VVEVPRRQVLDVVLLENPPEEVDRLVQGVNGIYWVEIRPKSIEYLIAGARQIGARQEKAKKPKHFSADRRTGHNIVAHSDRHPALVLDKNGLSDSPSQSPADRGGSHNLAMSLGKIAEQLNIRPFADLFQKQGRAEPIVVGFEQVFAQREPPSGGMKV
jgi:hypothetical protein